MIFKQRKGKTLIVNLEANWIEEVGERPTDNEIINHLLVMTDEEFDCYMEGKKYVEREEVRDYTEQKELERQEKHPKTRNFYTKRNNGQ